MFPAISKQSDGKADSIADQQQKGDSAAFSQFLRAIICSSKHSKCQVGLSSKKILWRTSTHVLYASSLLILLSMLFLSGRIFFHPFTVQKLLNTPV